MKSFILITFIALRLISNSQAQTVEDMINTSVKGQCEWENLISELILNGKKDDIRTPIFICNTFVRSGKIRSVEKIEFIHKGKSIIDSISHYTLEYDTLGLLRQQLLGKKAHKIAFQYNNQGYFTGIEEEFRCLSFGGITISGIKIKEEITFNNRGLVLQKKTFFEGGDVKRTEYIYEKKWLISEIKEFDEKNKLAHHYKFMYVFY